MKPISSYSRQSINKTDIKNVIKTLKSDFLTTGPQVLKFENRLKKIVKAKFAVASNSATSSLHTACLALDIKKNDHVWTSSISFVASANCAIYCGAKVDFVDIDSQTFNICPNKLEKKLLESKIKKKLPKILVVVHMGGEPCEMKKIYNLSKKYNFKIIEDASHALGSKYNGKLVGNCKYSEITVFSFHPVKIATSCEGGMATTNSATIAKRLTLFREHGIEKDIKKFEIKKNRYPFYYEQQNLGYNYRLSDVHAALGASQLNRIDLFIKKRNLLRVIYEKSLKKLPIKFQKTGKKNYSSNHLVIISVEIKIRNKLISFLKKNKITTNIHYIPIFFHPYHYKKKHLTNKESIKYYNSSLSIPNYYDLSLHQHKRIIDKIKIFFKK